MMTINLSLEKKIIRYRRMIEILLGEGGADIILQGGNIINVITREIYKGDVAIKDEYILMTGDCSCVTGSNTKIIDVSGKYISPGFIDAHMHFESSMLTATEFSRLSVPTGTTTMIADPHEIGNVLGVAGVKAMLKEAEKLPNRVLFTVPCLVPDVPGLETAGDSITSRNIAELLSQPLVQGIGEMQGFSNVKPVFEHTPGLLDDLLTSVYCAKDLAKTVEGNAPALFGKELAAHIIACGGETSCHETTTKEECVEKLRQGVTVFMREGSTQRNMSECIRAVTEEGLDSRKLVLASDDMVSEDLIRAGHMNDIIRRTIAQGVDPVEAIQMATINSAQHFGLKDIGVIAPGKAADIVVISDLLNMKVDLVLINGSIAARDGGLILDIPAYIYPQSAKDTVKRKPVKVEELVVRSSKSRENVRGIEVIPEQNLTGCFQSEMNVSDGYISPASERDVLPLIAVERHGRSQRIGKTFVRGMGLKAGAIAQSIGHDTHNIIACGTDYNDIAMAVNRVIAMNGGIAVIKNGKVVGDLPLPVGGLMTDELSGSQVCDRIGSLCSTARDELGSLLNAPFMHLSFLSLVTSPKVKITDMGLIDTENYEVIPTVI